MTNKLLFTGLVLICACAAQNAVPLACNLKAFTAAERAEWNTRVKQVLSSVTGVKDLSDGYTFEIDTRKTPFLDVARWVELERKCCPFFVFELGMRGENGNVWLNLRGGKGVKEFIAADFHALFDK
jgi:hypothetical protein